MDKLNTKEWADRKYKEYKDTINFYIKEGITKAQAFKIVMDDSTLGAGYRAQMRKDIGLSMFE